ncbi:hypothetical protein ACF1GT_16995 [Streptomyces sp. NPDC014636]|uniref:hypothetical protein n=1 Tax=Streptomyces sp. NPDC014636 TaxID=3364876 RepID=UPI0036F8C149
MAHQFFTEVVDGLNSAEGQVSLTVDETNTPWIAYATGTGNVVLARREEDKWATEELPAEPAARDDYRIGLAIDSTLRPHVAYQSRATDHLIYGVRDTQWHFEEVPTDAGIFPSRVRFACLKLNPGIFSLPAFKDTPNFSYQSGLTLWHAAKQPPRANPNKPPQWRKNVHKVDEGDLVEKGWFTSLDFDAEETLRIASFDDLEPAGQSVRRLRVATLEPEEFPGQPESWRVEVVHGGQILGELPSMAHSITGESIISYYERNGRTLNVCIMGNFPESPAIEVVSDVVGGDDVYSACGVSNESRICVAFGSGGRLRFATRTGIKTFSIEDVEAGGAWSDMVFDSEGSAHIAHIADSALRYGVTS